MNKTLKILMMILVAGLYSCVEPEQLAELDCDPNMEECQESNIDNFGNSDYFSCVGSTPSYATLCGGDDLGLLGDSSKKLVASCSAANKCEYICNSGYEQNATGSGCIEDQGSVTPPPSNDDGGHSVGVKNYLQISNTFSSLTGVSTKFSKDMNGNNRVDDEVDINIEATFQAILVQLPSSNNAESLNGFNQIAQTRLAFEYCHAYMENNYSSQYMGLTNNQTANKLLDSFLDVDYVNNIHHQALKSEVLAILNNSDSLLASADKRKLGEMACSAVLASAYVTLL